MPQASELFYAKGAQSVGIDRVIEHAGVAKATLYSALFRNQSRSPAVPFPPPAPTDQPPPDMGSTPRWSFATIAAPATAA
jgi:hypothetical protein